MNCKFTNHRWHTVGMRYTCWVKNIVILSEQNRIITGTSGIHIAANTDYDVKGVVVENSIVQHFPSNIMSFFPNVNSIYFHGSKMKGIHQNDLRPFGYKLMLLHITESEIDVLEKNLFEFNPNLKFLAFSNQIKYVDANIFENLPRLITLLMPSNKCVNENADNNRENVLKLILKIKDQCFDNYMRLWQYQYLESEKFKLIEEIDNFKNENVNLKIQNGKLKNEMEILRKENDNLLAKLNNVNETCEFSLVTMNELIEDDIVCHKRKKN